MPKGGGVIEGLWTGTAFFAASRAKTFTGFLSNFLMYAVVLIIGFIVVSVVLKAVTGKEMFTVSEIQCPSGSRPGTCPGSKTQGCVTASGNCNASLVQ